MERSGWLIAVIGCVVLGGLILLGLLVVGVFGLGLQADAVAVTRETAVERPHDPGRSFAGVVVAVVLITAAIWVVKRTDWSLED